MAAPGFTIANPVTGNSVALNNLGKFNVDWLNPIIGIAINSNNTPNLIFN
jgi:hypothetical protein